MKVSQLDNRHGFERAEVESLAKDYPHKIAMARVETGEAGRPGYIARLI